MDENEQNNQKFKLTKYIYQKNSLYFYFIVNF